MGATLYMSSKRIRIGLGLHTSCVQQIGLRNESIRNRILYPWIWCGNIGEGGTYMKDKLKRTAALLTQFAAIWLIGWACCLGIGRLMILLNLGG